MASNSKTPATKAGDNRRQWMGMAGLLAVILCTCFYKSFLPDMVHFNNDAPLGHHMADCYSMRHAFSGVWVDANSIGLHGGTPALSPTYLLEFIAGPRMFLNLYPLMALFILGFGAWFFFRRLGLSALACILGGLAGALNSAFFSAANWGVASQQVAIGMDLIAMGLVVANSASTPAKVRWARTLLAGIAVGVNIAEGADIGAILSLFVAAYVVWHSIFTTAGTAFKRTLLGGVKVAVIALFAAWFACGVVKELLNIAGQTQTSASVKESDEAKAQRWAFTTQWSFPKRETLSLVVPGLFGFRMDTPGGGNYWGIGGSSPVWDDYFSGDKKGPPPSPNQFTIRQAGGGVYAGVLVVFVAIWAVFQALRRDSVFSPTDRKLLWFWIISAVASLLFAYGRFAPFFQLIYHLPFLSTIRNPGKYVITFTISLLVLFAYGIHGLSIRYLGVASAGNMSFGTRLKTWWGKAIRFDRYWVFGSFAALLLSLVAWAVYDSSAHSVADSLAAVHRIEGYSEATALDTARAQVEFSIGQVGWYIVSLTVTVGLTTLILAGFFSGKRAKVGGVLLGILLVADLGLADRPWIIYWNYQQKYLTNPIIDFLAEKPYEHRVAKLPLPSPGYLGQLYDIEWSQHLFLYYNIQSLDLIQLPRWPQDLAAYQAALSAGDSEQAAEHLLTRKWELSNTRYLLGGVVTHVSVGNVDTLTLLNKRLDPKHESFRIVQRFDLVKKPWVEDATSVEDLTAEPDPKGNEAVFEYGHALPRACLYTNWQVSTNDDSTVEQWVKEVQQRMPAEFGGALAGEPLQDQKTLYELTRDSFHPTQTVLLSGPLAEATASTGPTNQAAGAVDFASYAAKDIKLKAIATANSVLLLNDRYVPDWQVWVDGKREQLLRCNFIMRGVYLTPGEHTVEFLFKPDVRMQYVSGLAILFALGLIGFLAFSKEEPDQTEKPAA